MLIEYLPGTLQTNSIIAVINSPGLKTKIAFFKYPLPLNTIILPPTAVTFNSLQPTTHKFTHSRVDVFGLLPSRKRQTVRFPPSQPFCIVVRKLGYQGQYFLYVSSHVIFIFYCIFYPEIVPFESRLQFLHTVFSFAQRTCLLSSFYCLLLGLGSLICLKVNLIDEESMEDLLSTCLVSEPSNGDQSGSQLIRFPVQKQAQSQILSKRTIFLSTFSNRKITVSQKRAIGIMNGSLRTLNCADMIVLKPIINRYIRRVYRLTTKNICDDKQQLLQAFILVSTPSNNYHFWESVIQKVVFYWNLFNIYQIRFLQSKLKQSSRTWKIMKTFSWQEIARIMELRRQRMQF